MVERRFCKRRIGATKSALGLIWCRGGGGHVDLRTEPQMGGLAGDIEVEYDPLSLAQHPENRTFKGVGRQVVLAAIRVAQDDALARTRVVCLDDALHAH